MDPDAAVNEEHLREVERVMLYVSGARERAAKSREILAKGGAEPFLIAALEVTETSCAPSTRACFSRRSSTSTTSDPRRTISSASRCGGRWPWR
ncbi:MAG TPA: hypothetical protein VIM22_11825 [Solirubrobacteraceae bacterium]|jgi:hypothetical protein